jgi:hypothetical protein
MAFALLLCAAPLAVSSPCRAAGPDAGTPAGDHRACKREPVPPEKDAQKLGGCLSATVFVAGGGGDGLVVTGTVADPTKPFTLKGTFPGGASLHTYTPTSAGGGTSTYTLSGSGVTGTGRGTYTLKRQGGNWALIDTTNGCVTGIPGSCRSRIAKITLTARSLSDRSGR